MKNNECEIVCVYGMPEGVGKSNYVSHCLADTQGFLKEKDWDKLKWMWKKADERPADAVIWDSDYESAKPLIKYPPEDVVSWLMDMLLTHKKVPMWHWDDAGTWLNGMEYNDPFVISFMEFLPLARSVCGLVVLSTPVEEWLLKKLRTATGIIHAPIIKLGGDAHFWRPRQCKAFRNVRNMATRRLFPQYQWDDKFPAIVSDRFYKWYKPMRDYYTALAVAKMQASLEKRKLKGFHVEIDESVLQQIRASIDRTNEKVAEFHEVIQQIVQKP
jgi:hypothetical protein